MDGAEAHWETVQLRLPRAMGEDVVRAADPCIVIDGDGFGRVQEAVREDLHPFADDQLGTWREHSAHHHLFHDGTIVIHAELVRIHGHHAVDPYAFSQFQPPYIDEAHGPDPGIFADLDLACPDHR